MPRRTLRIRRSIFARMLIAMIGAGLVALALSTFSVVHIVGDDKEAALMDTALRRAEVARARLDHRIEVTRARLQAVAMATLAGRVHEVAELATGGIVATLCKRGDEVVLDGAADSKRAEQLRSFQPPGGRTIALVEPYLLHVAVQHGDVRVRALLDLAPLFTVPTGWQLTLAATSKLDQPQRRWTAGERVADENGIERVRVRSHSRNGIVVDVRAPLAPAREAVLAITRSMVAWSALAVVPLILLAWTLSRALTSPIRALATAVRRAPSRQLQLPNLPRDEIGDLAHAIAAMSERLRYDAKALNATIRFARLVVACKEPDRVFAMVEKSLRRAFSATEWAVVPIEAVDEDRVQDYVEVDPDALKRFAMDAKESTPSLRPGDDDQTQRLPVRTTVLSDDRAHMFVSLQTELQKYGVLVGIGVPDDATVRHCELYCRFAVVVLQNLELFGATLINEKLTTLGRLAAGVAHEMNNPLTFVLANLRMLEADLGGEQKEAAQDAREGAERLARIAQDLSAIAKEPTDLRMEDSDLRQLVRTSARMAQSRAARPRIVVEGDAHLMVRCDRVRIGQVLVNLLANAQDAVAAQPDGRVVVRVFRRATTAIVEVEDNGPGVKPSVRRRLFEAFFTTKRGSGTGLGLYLSRSLAFAHGGSLDLERTGAEGSVFCLQLPAGQRASSIGSEALARVSRPSLRERPRVLVLDDEEGVIRGLERWLGRYADVVSTTDPDHALNIASKHDFTLVLCDLHMPRMGGGEFVASLRERNRAVAERVVIMTGTGVDRPTGVRVVDKPLSAELMQELLGAPHISDPPPASAA